MFRRKLPFDKANVRAVPCVPGVYIIYKHREPFYIVRSRVDIHERLSRHLHGSGSQRVARENRSNLTFEYQEMWSVEQAESILIDKLGTTQYGNVIRVTDPADW